MQAYFEPEQAFSISMPKPVFEISIAYEKTWNIWREDENIDAILWGFF